MATGLVKLNFIKPQQMAVSTSIDQFPLDIRMNWFGVNLLGGIDWTTKLNANFIENIQTWYTDKIGSMIPHSSDFSFAHR